MNAPCRACGAMRSPSNGGCTNCLCATCHRRFCTPGGSTEPGHNVSVEAARATLAAERAMNRKYHIQPKRDFGGRPFLINGKMVARGFVVTDGGMVNVMPGATWFQTIREALRAITCLEASRGNAERFWQMMRGQR